MNPYKFEVYMFLKVNRRFWGMDEVLEAERLKWEPFDGGETSLSDNDDDDSYIEDDDNARAEE